MTQGNSINLDALYAEWNTDRASANPTPLTEWVARYPSHQADILQWAADAPLLERAATIRTDPEAEARSLAIGMRVVREMRAKYAPMTSLLERAKSQGFTTTTLAQRLGVTAAMVTSLHRRLFRFATLPQELIRRASDALQVTPELMCAYLQQPPALAQGARYSSDTVPQVVGQTDFAQAIQKSSLSEEQKRFWLSAE